MAEIYIQVFYDDLRYNDGDSNNDSVQKYDNLDNSGNDDLLRLARIQGISPKDTMQRQKSGILSGRPYGDVCILWRKSISKYITVVQYDDKRMTMAVNYVLITMYTYLSMFIYLTSFMNILMTIYNPSVS